MSHFSPLDMLFMPPDEQAVLRCLNRQPRLSFSKIADSTRIPPQRLEELLENMISDGHLVEQYKDGQRTFSVRFARAQESVRNMPRGMMELFEQQPDTFLTQVPLTANLSETEREALLAKSVKRPILPDEVYVWQGKSFKHVAVVRNGLVRKSRLQHRGRVQSAEYLRRFDWLGLAEVLAGMPSAATFTAATEGELLTWPADFFLEFLQNHPGFALTTAQMLAHVTMDCQDNRKEEVGRLWVLAGVQEGVGATTVATRLAQLVAQMDSAAHRVLLWNATGNSAEFDASLSADLIPVESHPSGSYTLHKHPSGLHFLSGIREKNYPPQVLLDMLLTDFQARYDYIICDSGVQPDDELTLRLRGRAETLIMLTDDPHAAGSLADAASRQAYASPGQKRMLLLNRARIPLSAVDPAFHLVIGEEIDPITHRAGPSDLALQELLRRLSLTHSIGIFIPSTLDVNSVVDNSEQVKATLAFLGSIFGGATSSEADGVWRSEDSGLVTEQVTIVRTFVSKQALEANLDSVLSFATVLKRDMRQEAVALDVDNQLLLV